MNKIEKALEEAEKYSPPMFHPVSERSKDAWFPANLVGRVASRISHIWEDILCLVELRKKVKTDYEKKLLFKYIVIELTSILEELKALQGEIFKKTKNNPSFTNQQRRQIEIHFKEFHIVKNKFEKDLVAIRNNIGAHRGEQSWIDIMELWDKLDPDIFMEIFIILPKLFNFLLKLDIYDFTRKSERSSTEFCISGLKPPIL